MNLFYQPGLKQGINTLEGDEAHHAKVLRLSIGSQIMVTDGKGLMTTCAILSIEKTALTFSVLESTTHHSPFTTHLFVAPTKSSDRIEWLVEKATEIGVTSITLAECFRSERRKFGHDRLIKVAVSAMKQSQQSWLPEINALTPFKDLIKQKSDQNFIAFVDHTNPDQLKNLAKPGKSYSLLIGPEGDFTDEEIDLALKNNWQKVSLGPTRLRTETAALAGILTLSLTNS